MKVRKLAVSKEAPDLGTFVVLGTTTAVLIALGLGIGYLADRSLNTLPLFMLIGLGLGVAGSIATVVNELKKYF